MIVGLFFVAVTICLLANQVNLSILTPQHYTSMNFDYVVCQSSGIEANKDCEQFIDTSETLPIYVLSLITIVLQAIIPLVTLLVNIDYTFLTMLISKHFPH